MRFKFVALVFLVIFVLAAGVHSLLTAQYAIHSSGTISFETGPLAFSGSFSSSSELRYTYFGSDSMAYAAHPEWWTTIADILATYDMGPVIQKSLFTFFARFPLTPINGGTSTENLVQDALDALHARGIQYQVSMNIMYGSFDPSHESLTSGGVRTGWCDPTNPDYRAHIKAIVEDLVRRYEIDGFSFDYVRYDSIDMPYGPYAKAHFENWLGESVSDADFQAGGAFAPGGARYIEFNQWRPQPIIELVRDMRKWMDDARALHHPTLPPLEYTITCWGMLYNFIYYYGQDAIGMVKEGAIDVLLPMMYMADPATTLDHFRSYQALVGGPEGVVPIAPLIGGSGPYLKTPEQWKLHYDAVMSEGTDGWSIWCYDGDGSGPIGNPDNRLFWDLVPRQPRFSLRNISAVSNGDETQLTVSWTTDLPATSKVEYSTSPLFVASMKQDPWGSYEQWIKYWDFDYSPGTIIEDTTPKTSHQLTISGLVEGEPLYYRIQGEDSSGIATSKVYTFQL